MHPIHYITARELRYNHNHYLIVMDKTLVSATVLLAAALTGIFLMSGYAQGEESETNTDQSIAQKNIGSGESTKTPSLRL